jgi:hypothetical protein
MGTIGGRRKVEREEEDVPLWPAENRYPVAPRVREFAESSEFNAEALVGRLPHGRSAQTFAGMQASDKAVPRLTEGMATMGLEC